MTDIKFPLSEDIIEKMNNYPEINWELVAQGAIEKYLEKLEAAEKLTSKSTFTTEDVDTFGEQMKQDMWKRHKYYHQSLKK